MTGIPGNSAARRARPRRQPSSHERRARRHRLRSTRRSTILVGIDTGGTFTDLVCFDGHRLLVHKLLSTPADPARAVLQGLRELLARIPPAADGRRTTHDARRITITYGSTVATNAVLERKGSRVVLLTTAGFEDVLEIGRQTRPDLYALEPYKPAPLVPRRRRLGVLERVTFDGRILQPLTPASIRSAVAAVRRLKAESVAVCLLHAYTNPGHERALGRAVGTLNLPCSLSHELVAEYREYERLSTTVINAYVTPLMSRHLRELQGAVGRASLRVVQSTGGAISVATASREAVRTLLSGPAGGVIGAVTAARRLGRLGGDRLITLDMGGTSTDVSLVDGEVRHQTEWNIADLPVKVPAIDIHTVGAGGGSLAYADPGGALKVGPESAGADPGPACYGRGNEPTVTDADLLLGRLVPDAFLGGRIRLDVSRSERAVARLARALRLGLEQTAEGIVRVVNAGMERAIRRISVEFGHDPRQYTLVAFGGAAGMHVCELAMALGIRRVLVPYHPGVLCASGAVAADARRDYVQTVRLVDPPADELSRRFDPLTRRARREMKGERENRGPMTVEMFLDVRYPGQSYELQVPMTPRYRDAFYAAHRRRYGHADESRSVEVVNLRVVATAHGRPMPRIEVPRRASAPQPHRFLWNGRWLRAQRWLREALPREQRLPGPLLITEFSATTVLPPDWTVRAFATGDLLLEWRNK